MQYSDCRKPVVFVIDMVNGFLKEGPLHDERIADIIPSIQKLLDALACRNVFICDNHPPHTREFETFPKHCVIGSEEAEVVDELKPYVKSWISKNSTNTFHAQAFQEFIQEDLDYYQDIVVVGCCTDLCVLHFVLTLQTWLNEHNKKEYRIIVPKNCTETYDIPEIHPASKWNQVAWDMMQMNGVCVVDQLVD